MDLKLVCGSGGTATQNNIVNPSQNPSNSSALSVLLNRHSHEPSCPICGATGGEHYALCPRIIAEYLDWMPSYNIPSFGGGDFGGGGAESYFRKYNSHNNDKLYVDAIYQINKETSGKGRLLNPNPNGNNPEIAVYSASYYESEVEFGAAIFRSIIHGHMFQNGNKETGVRFFIAYAKFHGFETANLDKLNEIATLVAENELTDISEIAEELTK